MGSGVVDGVQECVHTTVEFLTHPLAMTSELIESIREAAHALRVALETYAQPVEFQYHDEPIDMGLVWCSEIMANVAASLKDYLKDHPYQAVHDATSLATQAFLTHKMVNALCNFFTKAAKAVPTYFEKLRTGVQTVEVQDVFAALALETVHQKPLDYAHSCVQYEKLKSALKIEEFTSIIDVTEHGLQRLLERGIQAEDLLSAIVNPDYLKLQSDGLKVYIKKISNDKYNVFIINPTTKKLVTPMLGLTQKSLKRLGNNYGWSV